MSESTIDRLGIEVSSNASAAVSGIDKLSSSLSRLSSAARGSSSGLSGSSSQISNVGSAASRAATSFTDLWAKLHLAKSAFNTVLGALSSVISRSNEYVEDLNLFTASMGDGAAAAQNYAEKVSEIMGIDPADWLRNQGIFNTIIEGFGVASDKAQIMSKNLTQLGYDISSYANIPVENAMQKLSSGISGELEPLRRLGYDLSVARLQQEAYNLGINKSVSSMTQAEKSQLRYYAIMTQVTVAQGDMARTINAPANQLRVLRAQLIMCARAIGNIFIPALNAILPVAIAVVKGIRMIANAIGSLVGFKLPKVDYSSITKGSSSMGTLANNAGNAADNIGSANTGVGKVNSGLGKTNKNLNKVAKTTKQIKLDLLSIDELHVLSRPDEDTANSAGSTGGDGGTGGGSGGGSGVPGVGGDDADFPIPTYDFLGKALESRADKILEAIKKFFAEVMTIIMGGLIVVGIILVATGVNIPLGVALIAIGAVGLATIIALNWKHMTDRLAAMLSTIMMMVGGFLIALGLFLIIVPSYIPLGIGLIAAGAVAIATAVSIDLKFCKNKISGLLVGITAMIGGALIALGLMLILAGSTAALGIALIAAGAVMIASAVAINWNGTKNAVKKMLNNIMMMVGGALIAIGTILLLTEVGGPIGIAMIIAGAIMMVTAVTMNWGWLNSKIKKMLTKIELEIGLASLTLGIILIATVGAAPLGVALIIVGAASLVSAAALNWNYLGNKIKGVLKSIVEIIKSVGLIAIGVMLCMTVIGLPFGISLIIKGVKSLVKATPWDEAKLGAMMKKKMDKVGKDCADGIVKGLKSVWNKIKEWGQGIVDRVKDFFKIHSHSVVFEEIGKFLAEGLLNGLLEPIRDIAAWFKEHVLDPIKNAVQNNPISAHVMVDLVKQGWETVKGWIGDIPGVSQLVGLAKQGWETIKGWIGDIPSLPQLINLAKDKWQSVKEWIGNIPVVSQLVKLVKNGWATVKGWVGDIPSLPQKIHLIKNAWSTVKGWIGNIPTLPQRIHLIKNGWSTVRNWIGNIPSLAQMIHLIKNGWSTVARWVRQHVGGSVQQGVTLAKHGWWTVAGWVQRFIGGTVSVGVTLAKGFGGLFGGLFGFEHGGFVKDGFAHFWNSVPKYANGMAGAHGSMFVAGENGAEMVGHINGQTEVLNKSQISQAMRAAVISGMAQFTGYWRSIDNTLIRCANAVIASNLDGMKVSNEMVMTIDKGLTALAESDVASSGFDKPDAEIDKEALQDAMYNAILKAVTQTSDGQDKNVNVYLDGDVIYRKVVQRNNEHVMMTGESEFNV